jgi:hypothetical protein
MMDGDRAPIELEHVRPLLFGWLPPHAVLGIGALGLVGGSVLAAADHVVGGALLLFVGVAGFSLYAAAARQAGAAVRAPQRAKAALTIGRGRARVAGAYGQAWSRAVVELAAARRERRAAARERDTVQHALGGAVHRDDAAQVAQLRERMRELDAEVVAAELCAAGARADARARVERASGSEGSTEVIRPAP